MTNPLCMLDDMLFDHANRSLTWQDNKVVIDPKLADLLAFLARNANQVINRDDILKYVWSNQIVNDHALTQTISELRKAFAKLDPEFKNMIKTVPKCGYKLVASVTVKQQTLASAVSISADDNISIITRSRFATVLTSFRQVRYVLWLAVLFILVFGCYWYGTSTAEGNNPPLLHADRIAFRVFASHDVDEHIAFGLSDLLNYRINSLSHYKSSLIYGDDSELIRASGLVISGELFSKEQQRKLRFKVYDNIVGKLILQQDYDLTGEALLTTPSIILADIGTLLEESFDQTIIVRTEQQYPAKLTQLNWIYEAHHAGNKVTPQSLHHAMNLYQRVLDSDPYLAIAVAEQSIAMRLLVDIDPGSIDELTYQQGVQRLMQFQSKLGYLPPVYYEARALHEFDPANLAPAENSLRQAVQVRNSWLSRVIEGKIAESKGLHFKANRAYASAYARKPNIATLTSIEYLLFPTDIKQFMPNIKEVHKASR